MSAETLNDRVTNFKRKRSIIGDRPYGAVGVLTRAKRRKLEEYVQMKNVRVCIKKLTEA